MKRDMDLARQILFAIEENPDDPTGWVDVEIPGRSDLEVSYHVTLLAEAGLIEAANVDTDDGLEWKPSRLTWQGHEFLDGVRSDTLWSSAKAETFEKTGGLAFDVLKAVVASLAKRSAGL
jgi:hypothetical protein